ncbi:unnamed protein product [Rotaria sp. Silwood1]|nr:unnamed protein product [Rotaria sp. Silwood1]CAF1520590.1 unnamed protein product [Rotaria sp. Silwood1]CAF3602858.1 unnamed protein product [Rotaria sp. Silwood1]CAF4691219.1 unnamed protein product [Rotaria sp. Silwood1]
MAVQILCVFFVPDQSNFLQSVVNYFQHANIINGGFHEKLAVILIPNDFNFDGDPIEISNEFNRLDVTLFLIINGILNFETWDFCCKLAHNTGGDYALLEHAAIKLTNAISLVLTGEDTLRQAFHQHIENHSIVMNNIYNVEELDFADVFEY